MGKPTEAELQEALAEAGRMREQGEDPKHVAKALLNLNYRLQILEKLAKATEHFLKFGQGAQEHTELLRLLEVYRRADAYTAGGDTNDMPGL